LRLSHHANGLCEGGNTVGGRSGADAWVEEADRERGASDVDVLGLVEFGVDATEVGGEGLGG